MNRHHFHLLASLLTIAGAGFLATTAGCAADPASPGDEDVGSADSELTSAQCSQFDGFLGLYAVCHKVSATSYVRLPIELSACTAHVGHAGDFIASSNPLSPLFDLTCQGMGCLPLGAPCDATLPCCDGNICANGVCNVPDLCDGAPPCTALDQCHVAGTCNPSTGECSNPPATDGTTCDDGEFCTVSETCTAGACGGGTPRDCYAEGYPDGDDYDPECAPSAACDPETDACTDYGFPGNGTFCHDGSGYCNQGYCVEGPMP